MGKKGKGKPLRPEAAWDDALQQEVEALVREWQAAQEQKPERFRLLCRLACRHRVNPEDFRSRLVRAGLPYSRASELKIILQSDAQAAAFLGESGPPQSWRATLAAARNEALERDYGLTDLDILAARLAGRLYGEKRLRLEFPTGDLVLEPHGDELNRLLELPAPAT